MQDARIQVTRLLHEWAAGDRGAFDRVVPLVYDELRRLAGRQLQRERSDHTLTPTALVHEAYLSLIHVERAGFRDRAHFLAMASRAMRRLLVDHARRRLAAKRGGGAAASDIEMAEVLVQVPDERVLELNDAIARLEVVEPRRARVLEYHYFGGLQLEEIAESLGLSVSSIKRDLRLARAWLASELGPGAGAPEPARQEAT